MMTRTRAATVALALSAAMTLALWTSIYYRVMPAGLDITNPVERGVFCGLTAASIVATGTYAYVTGSRMAVWVTCGIALAPAPLILSTFGGAGGIVRLALGPLLLAVILYILLGKEGTESDA